MIMLRAEEFLLSFRCVALFNFLFNIEQKLKCLNNIVE